MVDRLTPLDASFLYLEETATPMHIGGLAVFAPAATAFDTSQLIELVDVTTRPRASLPPAGA